MPLVLSDNEAKSLIAQNVSRLLDAKGWSQKQLADATEENEMTISRVVRGLHVPGVALLSRIAEALEVTVDALLSKPEKKSRRPA